MQPRACDAIVLRAECQRDLALHSGLRGHSPDVFPKTLMESFAAPNRVCERCDFLSQMTRINAQIFMAWIGQKPKFNIE